MTATLSLGRVLITGATGLLGSELTRQLLAEGADVRILRRESSSLDLLGESAHQVEHAVGEITNPEAVDAAMQDIDTAFHLAARIGFGGRREAASLFATNAQGTAVVVNAALRHRVKRLVHTSSIAALGRSSQNPGRIDETIDWRESKANSSYARSKHAAELEIQRGVAEGLDAVIVNPALIFGPGRSDDNTGKIVDKVRRQRLPFYPTGGTCVVDVADVANGLILAARRGAIGERYILGGDNLSWQEILTTLAKAFGVKPPSMQMPAQIALAVASLSEATAALIGRQPLLTRETASTSSRTYEYSSEKARRELGYEPRPFAATARRIAAHFGKD